MKCLFWSLNKKIINQFDTLSSSNLQKFVETIVTFSSKLSVGWTSSPVRAKENLQKLVFPSGINYNVKKEAFRTEKVNELFSINASLNSLSEDDIKENGGIKTTVSNLVGRTGFEPATPWSQTRYSTGLNYLPKSSEFY